MANLQDNNNNNNLEQKTTDNEGSNKKKKLQKSYFDVLGLCCTSEVPLIENLLKTLDGVKEFSVVVPTKTVIVVHDNLIVSQIQIMNALNKARLEANVRAYGGNHKYKKKWPSPYAVASGVLLLVSLFKYVYPPMRWVALGAVAVGIVPIFLKAVASVRRLRLDTNILMLIAVTGTIALKDYIEAGTIVFLFTIAEWLESRASHQANAVMSSVMSLAPQKAVIAETGEEVDADEVKLNTVLAVKAGEVIPIDGVVVDGKCEVDEKSLTGESFPAPKEIDSTVWAGTINLNGYISVRTTAIAEDCVVAKMAKLVEEAQKSKSRTERLIDRVTQYYTPAVILVSAGIAVIPLVAGVRNHKRWFATALVMVVSACPCALILSTPVATFCALTRAATSGLLIKGGDYLETLSKIKVMAFDKTGTLTRGEFVVTNFQTLDNNISLDALLYWVSSIESRSSHPLAAALVDYGRLHSIDPKPDNVNEFQNFPGEGICGIIDGRKIYIGNKKIAQRVGAAAVPTMEGDDSGGKTVGYIYIGPTLAGMFAISDACRTGAAEAIKDLKLMGIKSVMLTGDCQAAATHAQNQLGNVLDAVHAELLPEDKAKIIREFKKEGLTAMIGDGLNDAPALATSDIGISMGISGSPLAMETGHVILMSNDIGKLPKVIQLARNAHRKIIQNIFLSISTKGAILVLAFAGHPFVWAAVLADVGTCLLVILNSMLLLGSRGKQSHCENSSNQKSESCCDQQAPKTCNTQKSICCSVPSESNHLTLNSCGNKCTDSSSPHENKSARDHENSCNQKSGSCCDQKALKTCNTQKSRSCSAPSESSHLTLNSCGNNKCTDSSSPHEQKSALGHENSCNQKSENCCDQKAPKPCNTEEFRFCSVPSESNHTSVDPCGNKKCTDSSSPCEHESPYGHVDDIYDQNTCPDDDCDTEANYPHCRTNSRTHENTTSCQGQACNKGGESASEIREHKSKGREEHCHLVHHEADGHGHAVHIHSHNDAESKVTDRSKNNNGEEINDRPLLSFEDEHVKRMMRCGMSLKKREIGGCCKSYRKECCSKYGHHATGFGGSLSEIVLE